MVSSVMQFVGSLDELDVNAVDAKSGMSILQCLKKKHPEPSQIDAHTFLACDVLPSLIEIDINASHVEQAACSLRWS